MDDSSITNQDDSAKSHVEFETDKEKLIQIEFNSCKQLHGLFLSNFNKIEYSDLIINVNDKQKYYVNKFMLASLSDIFNKMFFDSNWFRKNDQNISCINLSEDIECELVFEKFLIYFYTAKIEYNSNKDISSLLVLADKYNVKPMISHLKEIILIKVKSPNLNLALDFYHISVKLGIDELISECLTTFKYNMETLINIDDWLKLDIDLIETLLKHTDLIVSDELILFDSIIRWLTDKTYDKTRSDNFESYSKKLIPLIRFSQMFETQLYLVENSNIILLSPEWFKQLIKQYLSKAYRFRCLEEVIVKMNNTKNVNETNNNSNKSNLNEIINSTSQISLRNNLFSFLISNESIPNSRNLENSSPNLHSNQLVEPYNEWYIPRNYTETCMADKVNINKNVKISIQYDAKLFRGLVPKLNRIGEWKILYRSSNSINNVNNLVIRIVCMDNAFIDKSIKARITFIIFDDKDRVIQVENQNTFLFNSNQHFEYSLSFNYPNESQRLLTLIRQSLF